MNIYAVPLPPFPAQRVGVILMIPIILGESPGGGGQNDRWYNEKQLRCTRESCPLI